MLANEGKVGSVRLLSPATIDRVFEVQADGIDLVTGVQVTFGIGFGLSSDELPMLPAVGTCFWGGWGGSLVVVDLDARFAFSYVMNKMSAAAMGDPRGLALAIAAFQGLQQG